MTGPRGVGKTLLSLGLAKAAAVRAEVSVAYVSTTDEPESLREATAAAGARVLVERARSGGLSLDPPPRFLTGPDVT